MNQGIMSSEPKGKYTTSALRVGDKDSYPQRLVGEFIGAIVSNDFVNEEYKHLVMSVHEHALKAYAGQMFHLLCPSPDGAEVWMRRPMSVYRVNKPGRQIEFLYKVEGRGTQGMGMLRTGDEFNIAGPLGNGFKLQPDWKNIVVLGRGVGIATLGPISQLAKENGVGVTAILSARDKDFVMAGALFAEAGDVISVLDTDGTSAVENVEKILDRLIAQKRADAFFTCGSNRLFQLMKRVGKAQNIPGQVAMEQVMACGLGPCYVCVRTFEVNGKKELRRVCIEGPVFDMQEAVGW